MSVPTREPPVSLPFGRAAALVAAVALFVYAQTVLGGFPFVNYDDPELVSLANPSIRDGLFGGLGELLDPTASPRFMHAWLPLYYWSIGLDHALATAVHGDAGAGAWIFHLHSALLHALAAVLVVRIGLRLGLASIAAAAAGLVFAAHPVAVESVAWVASRKDVLSFVWMAFAALAYLRGVDEKRPGWHALGAAALFVSLLAKGTTLVLPLLLAVHAWLLLRSDEPLTRRLTRVAPYAGVALVMTIVHAAVAAQEGTAFAGGAGAGLGSVLVANLEVVGHWTVAFLVPLRQSVEHGITPGEASPFWVVLGAAVLILWAAGLRFWWKKRPAAAALLLAIPLALAPFNNVFPRTTVLFAERYAYVPLLVVALGLGALLTRSVSGARGLFPGIAVVGALTILSLVRIPAWSDSERLWADAVEKAPESALAHLQLGQARSEKYAYVVASARAVRESDAAAFERARAEALRLDDDARSAWKAAANLTRTPLFAARARAGLAQHLLASDPLGARAEDPGAAKQRLERIVSLLDEAERDFRTVAEQAPPGAARQNALRATLVEPLGHRATARELLGDHERALADWMVVTKLDGENARGYAALGRVHRVLGDAEQCVRALERSREFAPREPSVVQDRVKVWLSLGDYRRAKDELETALVDERGEPLRGDAQIPLLLALGRMNRQLQRPLDAAVRLREALAIRPTDPAVRQALGEALLDQAQALALRDDIDEARKQADEAMELMPDGFAPHQILAIIERRRGNLDEATAALRRALELFPRGRRIRQALASILLERAALAVDDSREGRAIELLEEAVAVGADVVATPHGRLELGVAVWPPAPEDGDAKVLFPRVEILKGFAWLAVGRAVEARDALEGGVSTLPATEKQLHRIGADLLVRACFATGRVDRAIEQAERLAALGPGDDEEAWYPDERLARAFVERGIALRGRASKESAAKDFERARALLDEAVAAGMPAARMHLTRGEILFAEERFLAATSAFDQAVRLDPHDVDAYLDLAAVWRTQYLLEEDPTYLDGAKLDLERALTVAPGDARVLAGLGETLAMQGQQSEAFPLLMRAVLADPSQKAARLMAARLMIQVGRKHLEAKEVPEAREVADRAVALDPPHPDALLFLAEVLRAQNDWERARVTLEDASERFPDHPEPAEAQAKFYADLGHGYLLKGDRARAVTAFKRALTYGGDEQDPDGPRQRLVNLASQLFREGMKAHETGDPDRAAWCFALSAEADEIAETWFALGIVRGKQEEYGKAVDAYDRALEVRPDYPEAILNRANARLRLGRLDAGEADFRRWLALTGEDDPKREAVIAELAWIAKLRAELEDGGSDDR